MQLLQQTVLDNPYIPYNRKPHEAQAVFLTAPVLELMYGGAGGGGKSAALLMGALQYVTHPGYNAILFRNSFADLNLPDGLIPMSHEWLRGTGATWKEQTHTWLFPSGARVVFGYMETDADRWRYKSAQFQYVGFDELTSFSRVQYLFLFSRLRRRIGLEVPIRMRSATNPGGPGHDWVKRRFIGEKGHPVRHPDRLFIPATMHENPFLDVAAYEESLQHLPPHERAQIQHGDWDVRPDGTQFKREWFESKIIDRMPCGIKRVARYWDLASTVKSKKRSDPDFTAGGLMLEGEDGNFYIGDMRKVQATPKKVEVLVRKTADRDGYDTWVGLEEEGGSAGKIVTAHYRDVLRGFTLKPVHPTGDKVRRSDPFASACEGGKVFILKGPWVDDFLDELCAFDGQSGHDDQVDAVVGAFTLLTRGSRHWSADQWKRVFAKRSARIPKSPLELLQLKMKRLYRTPRDILYPDGTSVN